MRTLLLFVLLLTLSPLSATALDGGVEGPPAPRQLNLVPLPEIPGLPEVRQPAATMDEATMKTARNLNPFLKIAPLAIGIPTGVAGVSLAASVPIALSVGDTFGAAGLRSAGLGLMGVSYGSTLVFNILGRSLRFLLDVAPWHKDIGFFIVGASVSIAGAVFVTAGAYNAGIWPDGATAAALAGGATLWGVGMAFLIIDTVRIAWRDNDPAITWTGRSGPQFAGVWAAPNERGGASAGVALRW